MPTKILSRDVHGHTYEVPVDQLSWRPSAYATVLKGNALLVSNQYGKYHLPGGGVDLGEMPEDAAIREVKEETGVTVAKPKFIEAVSGFYTFAESPESPLSHVQTILMYYQCEYVSGELSTDGLDAWERRAQATAEWLPLARLEDIEIGTTFNWRHLVDKVIARPR